jgi:hypothetical protein
MCAAEYFASMEKDWPVSDHDEAQRTANGRVNISRLKRWAYSGLRPNSNLRSILLAETEVMTVWEFLAKSSTWLKIAQLEEPRKSMGA